MSDKKAMIKDTEEVFDVDHKFTTKIITMKIEYDIETGEMLSEDDNWIFNRKIPSKEGEYYKLSDGNTYSVDDIIVGSDNIRDFKINKLI